MLWCYVEVLLSPSPPILIGTPIAPERYINKWNNNINSDDYILIMLTLSMCTKAGAVKLSHYSIQVLCWSTSDSAPLLSSNHSHLELIFITTCWIHIYSPGQTERRLLCNNELKTLRWLIICRKNVSPVCACVCVCVYLCVHVRVCVCGCGCGCGCGCVSARLFCSSHKQTITFI